MYVYVHLYIYIIITHTKEEDTFCNTIIDDAKVAFQQIVALFFLL